MLERLLRRRHPGEWREGAEPVPLGDAAAGAELAREAATPFGYKRPAHELLARFGGEGADSRRRATVALELSGVVADPPLADAAPHQFVQLRRVSTAITTSAAAAAPAPAAAAPRDAAAPAPARARQRVGALLRAGYSLRRAPSSAGAPDVPADRRIAAGALGLGALAVLMVAVVLLRGLAGDGGETANALPAGTVTAPATTAPPRTSTPAPPAAGADTPDQLPPSRPASVRLRIVPTEPAYVCVADGAGRTLVNRVLEGPYAVRRPRLILRVGVATARIDANGRAIRVVTAPGAFELTPAGTRALPGDARVCGG